VVSDGERSLVGTQGVQTGQLRPGLLFAPLRERFSGRGPGVLCFVLARATHALGRGTVRCLAGARRRWSGGVGAVPGRDVAGGACACAGGVHWGVRSCCLHGQGECAAASRPILQGFRRSHRQRVGVRGGGSRVGGCMLAGRWWSALGCALLLRGRNVTCGLRGRG